MSVYVCGDIHGNLDIHKLSNGNWPEGKFLTKDDVLVILGDFGLIWTNESIRSSLYWLKWLANKPWQTYFIDGNHENFNRLLSNEFKDEFDGFAGNLVKVIYDDKQGNTIKYLRRGLSYNFNTKYNFLVCGGGQSVDKKYRTENVNWFSQEIPDIEDITRLNDTLLRYNFTFDYVLTHAISYHVLYKLMFLIDVDDVPNYKKKLFYFNKMEKFLETIENMITFKQWYCGHYHIDYNYRNRYFFNYNNKPIKVV